MDVSERCKVVRETLSIREVIEGWYGHKLSKSGRGTCPFCEGDNDTKFRLVDDKGFICASCEASGDVLKFVQMKESLSDVAASLSFIEEKMGTSPSEGEIRSQRRRRRTIKGELEEQARYVYLDEEGNPAYEIVRYWNKARGKKEFKPFKNGKMGLNAKDRILYNLNHIANITDEDIFIVEGEKACDAMTSLGFAATCNPFGCSQWKGEFGYGKYLEGKNIILLPDHDESGDNWLELVMDDLKGRINVARIIRFTKTWVKKHPEFTGHDIADYLEVEGEEKTREFIAKGIRKAPKWIRGFEPGITCSPNESYAEYLELMDAGNFNVVDFSEWLPSLNIKARRSDLVCFLAGTKVGKSRLLMNLMYFVNNINYLVFDLELGRTTVGERWCALHNGVSTEEVQAAHAMGRPLPLADLSHIRMANCGAKDMKFVRERIDAEEQMIGKSIEAVVIDYIGLMRGDGKSKTEMLSRIVEEFKGELNDLGKVGIVTSQRLRPDDKEQGMYKCPNLFDNKDSSAIENSSQLTIGFWKQRTVNRLAAQVLAYSHGNCDLEPLLLNVNELRITEVGDERRAGDTEQDWFEEEDA